MKKASTKGALFTSALALLLCFVMLLGTTFAWFTDEVTSTNNKIQAGTLNIDLLVKDYDGTYESVKESSEAIFDYNNWEPGYTALKYLKVTTSGTLALKYRLRVVVADGTPETSVSDIAEAIDVYYVAAEDEASLPVITGRDDISNLGAPIGTLRDFLNDTNIEDTTNELIPDSDTEDYAIIALKMQESAGNKYQGMALGAKFDINLYATQYTYEEDSFDKNYDKEAVYPAVSVANVEAGTTEPTLLVAEDISAQLPAGVDAGVYKLEVTNYQLTEDATTGETAVSYNIDLYKDDVKVSGVTIPVEIFVGPMLNITSVKHDGNEITNYTYDFFEGIVRFETTSFSPFEIVYNEIGKDVEVDSEARQITKGYFEGVDPATFDPSLAEADSKYIAVSYTENGKTCYAVAERATTVILAAGETYDAPVHDNYTVTTKASGKLYAAISGLKSNEFSTVYILPGTYNEATTINVYSSMDIIGLGDAEDIKIIKVKGSNSNRHLINCNGAVSRDDHIQVTIRNLYLDASAYNLNSAGKFYTADNAAVQSIRLSKVKCYDLIIKKSNGFPFYVNGKYDSRGAYLYVQDTVVNGTNSIYDKAPTYKFYYDGLTYAKGLYTYTDSHVKNTTMDPDDWEL